MSLSKGAEKYFEEILFIKKLFSKLPSILLKRNLFKRLLVLERKKRTVSTLKLSSLHNISNLMNNKHSQKGTCRKK